MRRIVMLAGLSVVWAAILVGTDIPVVALAEVNDSVSNSERWKKLSTSYISSRELTAWLPTKLWYWTRPSVRFVILKDGALCTAEANTSDKDFRTFSDRTARD